MRLKALTPIKHDNVNIEVGGVFEADEISGQSLIEVKAAEVSKARVSVEIPKTNGVDASDIKRAVLKKLGKKKEVKEPEEVPEVPEVPVEIEEITE